MTSNSPTDIFFELTQMEGRDFEDAVSEAFKSLGLRAENLIETEGEADILVFADRCERPFGVVVECTAKTGRGMVGQEKVGQVRSYSTQYMSRFKFAKIVFLCIVGRPRFSKNAIKASRGGGTKGGRGVCLLRFNDLGELVLLNTVLPISHDDLYDVFSQDGEVTETVHGLDRRSSGLLGSYAAVLATLDHHTQRSGKSVLRLEQNRLVGAVSVVLDVGGVGVIPDETIERAISDLSSPYIDLIRVDKGTVRRTSHEIGPRLTPLGDAGNMILKRYEDIRRFLVKGR